MNNKIFTLTLVLGSSLLLGGCTLLPNSNGGASSTMNVNIVSTPAANNYVAPSPVVSQSPEAEVKMSTDNDFDSLYTDLDKIDNLESVTVE